MKHLILILVTVLFQMNVISQDKEKTAIICGKIKFEQDSIAPLKPWSVILQKEWPVAVQLYKETRIDTTDFTFRVSFDVDQLTYGQIIVNFFPAIDYSDFERYGRWASSKIPDDFFGRAYAPRILFAGLKFIIEPGDSLFVEVDYEQYGPPSGVGVNFSGNAGPNNNHQRATDTLQRFKKSFKLPLEEGLRYEDWLMEERLSDLKEALDTISIAYYMLLQKDILFENLKQKHALIRASLYGPDVEVEKKRALARAHYAFLDTLNIRPEYISSGKFREFTGSYLEYLNRIITGRDIPHRWDEQSYWLAKAVFDEEVLRCFLYERLEYKLRTPFFYYDGIDHYKEFIRQFPGTPESDRLRRIFDRHIPVGRGNIAPDLDLVDRQGKSGRLSDLKGKVVIISTGQTWLSSLRNEQKTDRIEQLEKRFGKNLVFIAMDLVPKESGAFVSPSIDFYVKDDPDDRVKYAYKFQNFQRYNFLVGRDGTLRDCVVFSDLTANRIAGLVSEKYTMLTGIKIYFSKHVGAVIILLSSIISFTLVLLLVTRLRHRRQKLLKRQYKSELKAIRSQLNPHFLFNSLNSIQNYINKSDAKTANEHLAKFAQLMRSVIELSEKESVALREELEFNKTYIQLEQIRYGFKCNFDIAETIDQDNIEIPAMIIQPFVENAIVHGMAGAGSSGEILIRVRETDGSRISVEIKDNGKGFNSQGRKGFGLKSSRERIDLLNSQHRQKIGLNIISREDDRELNGTIVQLTLPKKY